VSTFLDLDLTGAFLQMLAGLLGFLRMSMTWLGTAVTVGAQINLLVWQGLCQLVQA
jgi:hypothetical protein